MAVLYDSTITRQDEAKAAVREITFRPLESHVFIVVETQDSAGNAIGSLSFSVGRQDEKDDGIVDYTLAQFIALVPAAATLHTVIEQALVDDGRIPAGTVT